MRAKFKSELLSFEAIILYIIITLIIIFGIVMYSLCNNKNEERIDEKATTELEEVTTLEITNTEINNIEEDEKENKENDVEKTTNKKTETTEAKTEEIKKDVATVEEPPELISLGEFRLTAYCKCSTCCGKWANSPTASGVEPRANHTIAVDTSVIPFGTKVIINGTTYTAEDTGSAIKGNRIDIYMSSHDEAMSFGVQYAEVFIVDRSE